MLNSLKDTLAQSTVALMFAPSSFWNYDFFLIYAQELTGYYPFSINYSMLRDSF